MFSAILLAITLTADSPIPDANAGKVEKSNLPVAAAILVSPDPCVISVSGQSTLIIRVEANGGWVALDAEILRFSGVPAANTHFGFVPDAGVVHPTRSFHEGHKFTYAFLIAKPHILPGLGGLKMEIFSRRAASSMMGADPQASVYGLPCTYVP